MYIKPDHQVIHKLQLKGFGILTLPLSHLDRMVSSSSIIPLKSIMKTIIRVSNNKSMSIGFGVYVLWSLPNYYVGEFVSNPVVMQPYVHSYTPYRDKRLCSLTYQGVSLLFLLSMVAHPHLHQALNVLARYIRILYKLPLVLWLLCLYYSIYLSSAISSQMLLCRANK